MKKAIISLSFALCVGIGASNLPQNTDDAVNNITEQKEVITALGTSYQVDPGGGGYSPASNDPGGGGY